MPYSKAQDQEFLLVIFPTYNEMYLLAVQNDTQTHDKPDKSMDRWLGLFV